MAAKLADNKTLFCHSGAKSNGAKNLKIEVLFGGVVKDNDFFLFRLAKLYALIQNPSEFYVGP